VHGGKSQRKQRERRVVLGRREGHSLKLARNLVIKVKNDDGVVLGGNSTVQTFQGTKKVFGRLWSRTNRFALVLERGGAIKN